MQCPNPTCQSDKLRIIDTAHSFQDVLPAEYRGLNIVRRRRECTDCKERFWTIELTAEDFQTLRRRSGRLEAPSANVRPIR